MSDETGVSKRIIVMEDEHTIRGILVKQLKNRGYQAEGASDGEAALALLAKVVEAGAVDSCLMILDLVVPSGLGGKETLTKAREMAPSVKAIIASGLTEEEDLIALLEPGRVEVLNKPYDLKVLVAKVEELLTA